MGKKIPDSLIAEFSLFIEENMGLSFPQEKWGDLKKGVQYLCEEGGFAEAETFIRQIISSPLSQQQTELLATGLTVGETYFFREKNALEAFENLALADIIRTRCGDDRRLRIWSAGCAGGEEPYTIAMMLKMLLPDLKEWDITILATDINPHVLNKAKQGVYTKWSFRDVPESLIDRFFVKKGSTFEILPEIKKMVTFSYLNLKSDDYTSLLINESAPDVIFCRNVLMYFASETVKTVTDNFSRCLTDGGYLIVSQTELNDEYFKRFAKAYHAGALLFKKATAEREKLTPLAEITRLREVPLYTPRKRDVPPVAAKKMRFPTTPPSQAAAPVVPLEGRPESDPVDAGALSLLARNCANQGRLDEALRHIEEALKADNMRADNHFLHSAILREKGMNTEAATALRKVVYLDTGFTMAYFTLGNIAFAAGNRDDAERHFNNALALLRKQGQDDIVPESEGMTAGRFIDMIESMQWRTKERR